MVVRTSVTEARQGIAAIEQELLTDHFLAQKLYVHQSYKEKKTTDILHILPPYDEYLISYKGTFIKYYKISQLIHTQSIAN